MSKHTAITALALDSTPDSTEAALILVDEAIDALDRLHTKACDDLAGIGVGPVDDCGEAPTDDLQGVLDEVGRRLDIFQDSVDETKRAGVHALAALARRVERYTAEAREKIEDAQADLAAANARREDW